MLLHLLTIFMLLCGSGALAGAEGQPEPRIPLDATTWTMSIEQVQRLPDLEHAPDGTLKGAYTIRANSQTELVARWQGRAVSFFFARDFGLYAIGVEMVPQADQHTPIAADPELQDLEQCAPIRLAVMRKYGTPNGLAESWEAAEVTPLSVDRTSATVRAQVTPLSVDQNSATVRTEAGAIDWPYARNWLIWEGQDTRLALAEQSVWYVSRAGLAQREQARQALGKEGLATQERDTARQAQRQQQLDQARQAVLSRAQGWESLF
jgi:hypothetical protein